MDNLKTVQDERIPKLVEEFSKMWTEYQDCWSAEYWELYDNRRLLLERQTIGINFTKFNEDELSSNNFVFVSNNPKEYPYNISTNNETFNKIENDLKNIDANIHEQRE